MGEDIKVGVEFYIQYTQHPNAGCNIQSITLGVTLPLHLDLSLSVFSGEFYFVIFLSSHSNSFHDYHWGEMHFVNFFLLACLKIQKVYFCKKSIESLLDFNLVVCTITNIEIVCAGCVSREMLCMPAKKCLNQWAFIDSFLAVFLSLTICYYIFLVQLLIKRYLLNLFSLDDARDQRACLGVGCFQFTQKWNAVKCVLSE